MYLDEDTNTEKTICSIIFNKLFSYLIVSQSNAQILHNILWKTKFNPKTGEVGLPDNIFMSSLLLFSTVNCYLYCINQIILFLLLKVEY